MRSIPSLLCSLGGKLAIACVAWGAFASTNLAQAAPIKVVASFSILGDFVQEVGGDRVELKIIAGPGQDAHVYEPRPTDVAAVSSADLIVVNGLHFEGFLERLIKAGAGKAPVVALSEDAELLPASGSAGQAHGDGRRHYDPHAWQSVSNAMVYVRNLAQALCDVDAQGCEAYRARAQAYVVRLEALDRELSDRLGDLPPQSRTMLTSHQAFRYLGKAYGLTFLSPTGLSTGAEATAADMRRLIEQLREHQVAAIFLEKNANPRLVQRLANETGMSVGATLYADTLSAPGGDADTYIDMMRYNGYAIAHAVQANSAAADK